MSAPSRLDATALDVVLDSLLANFPHAPIVAINETGFFVPMPLSVPLTGQRVIQGDRTALELVVREDMNAVVEAWTLARKHGVAKTDVHLANEPERAVTLHYVDAMHRHGVYIGLFSMVSSEDLMSALASAPTVKARVSLVRKDELAFMAQIDDALTEMLGWSAEEIVGHRSLEFIDPEDHASAIASWMDMLRVPGSRRRVRQRHKHRDGTWVWFEVTNHNLLNDPAHGYVLTEMLDISEEMATQEALRSRERLLHGLAEALPLGVLQIDRQGRIEYRNARVATLLGSGSAEHLAEQLATVLPAHRADVDAAVRCVLQEGGERDLEIAVAHGPHDVRCLHLSLRALRGDAGAITGAIVCLTDVTDSVRMREQLKDRATFDTLTRCYNRASILHLLQRTLAESPSSNELGTAVIFVDLDHFKQINDHLGHAAGDTFLIEVAHCLQQSVRDGDAVGRLGGDEFLIVCAGLESATKAVRLAQRIARSLRTTAIAIGREQIVPSASIGVAWSSAPTSADALVARADQAMYESKRLGRSRPVLAECQAPVRRAA